MNQSEICQSIASGSARLVGSRSGSQKAKPRKNDEELLQCACHSWNRLQESRFPLLASIFHCPNGGGRSKAEAGILKAMGVKPGVPDFMLPFPSGLYAGLAIELKSDAGVLSDAQRVWLQHAIKQNWCVAVVRDLEQYIVVVKEFLAGNHNAAIFGLNEISKENK